MKKIKEVLTNTVGKLANTNTIMKPTGLTFESDIETPAIIIGKEYIEILGHRIDEGFEGFDDFIEYINKLKEFDKEREKLESELRKYRMNTLRMQRYLDEQIAASIFLRDHIDGGERLSIQEKVYREIRDEFYKED